MSCCLLTLGDFSACSYCWMVENPSKWEVVLRGTAQLAVAALVEAFLINVNQELVHGFRPSLCPCREDIFVGPMQNNMHDCMWLRGRKYRLQQMLTCKVSLDESFFLLSLFTFLLGFLLRLDENIAQACLWSAFSCFFLYLSSALLCLDYKRGRGMF